MVSAELDIQERQTCPHGGPVTFYGECLGDCGETDAPQRFRVGDTLVYPRHGLLRVEHIGPSPVMPEGGEHYHLRLFSSNARLLVPMENRVKLRRLYRHHEVRRVFELLKEPLPIERPGDWKGLYRENLNRMNTGRLEDIVVVLRHLASAARRRNLGFRENDMRKQATRLLVSEAAFVESVPETETEKKVELLLEEALRAATTEAKGGPRPGTKDRSGVLAEVDLGAAYMALYRGDIQGFIDLHEGTGIPPRSADVVSAARKAFWRGEFDKAMAAYEYLGQRPHVEDVEACLESANARQDRQTAGKAADWLSVNGK